MLARVQMHPHSVFHSRRHAIGALTDRAVAAGFASKGVNAHPGSPAELKVAVAADIPYWGRIAKAAGAQN